MKLIQFNLIIFLFKKIYFILKNDILIKFLITKLNKILFYFLDDSAFHLAVYNENLEIVKLLLSNNSVNINYAQFHILNSIFE